MIDNDASKTTVMRLTALSVVQYNRQSPHGRFHAVCALQYPAACTGAIDGHVLKRTPPGRPSDADPVVADELDLAVLPFDRDRHQTDDHQHQQDERKDRFEERENRTPPRLFLYDFLGRVSS